MLSPAWEAKQPWRWVRQFIAEYAFKLFLWISGITLEQYLNDVYESEARIRANKIIHELCIKNMQDIVIH
jgi:hypothetical protein